VKQVNYLERHHDKTMDILMENSANPKQVTRELLYNLVACSFIYGALKWSKIYSWL